MSPSKILFSLCISFITGIFFGSTIKIPLIFIWGILFLAVLLIFFSIFYTGRLLAVLGFCFLFLIMGFFRVQILEFNITNDKLAKLNGKGEVVLIGFVSNQPVLKDRSQQLMVRCQAFNDTILVTTSRYPEYHYLDKIKITGSLEAPKNTEDFNYQNYLLKDGIYSVIGFPKIEIIGRQNPNLLQNIYSGIIFLKQKLSDSINKNFPSPESLVLQGLILGSKTSIPQDLKDKFNITGVSHIIAVSGTHIVILGSILMAFLLGIGISRPQSFYFSAFFIVFYVILVGLPSSGVRSAIMAIIFLLAQKLGRQSASSRVIVFACALMLFQNPLLLLYDIGFQLSFLAVLGLVYFDPLTRTFLRHLAKIFFKKEIQEKPDGFLTMFSSTISAQVFTLPIIVFNFGRVSFVSPLVNLLILPAVYYIMLFGFLSAIAGAIFGVLGYILSFPCHFLMVYFIFTVNLFSGDWAYKMIENVHWAWPFVSYFAIASFTWYLNKKYRQKLFI